MATTHRIPDDFFEESFSLIAIHSSLEDYALAYTLNRCLKTRFARLRTDLDIDNGISFPIFEWKDTANDRYWTLISNISRKQEKGEALNLFTNEPPFTTYHLIPEFRDVDFFMKIEGEQAANEDELIKELGGIPNLIAAYGIDPEKLKSRKYLIF